MQRQCSIIFDSDIVRKSPKSVQLILSTDKLTKMGEPAIGLCGG